MGVSVKTLNFTLPLKKNVNGERTNREKIQSNGVDIDF